MRTLRFIVDDQILKLDPSCDFDGVVPGTEKYLQAEFSFSPEWNGCVKVAAFYSVLGKEYKAMVLRDGKSCMIPPEALKKRIFKVRIVGKNGDEKITTNKVTVCQNGGKI